MSRIEFLPPPRPDQTAVAIVATGPSFDGVPFYRLGPNVHIIAVKSAIFALDRANSWMTVDANRRCRVRQMSPFYRKPGTQYFAAVPDDYGTPTARLSWHQPPAEPGIHYLERIAGDGLSEDPTKIHTGNSAYAALGLAYHMGFRRIGLFGVDGTQDLYGTRLGGRPRGSLAGLSDMFRGAIPQLQARQIEIRSAGFLKAFPNEKAPEVIQWLNGA